MAKTVSTGKIRNILVYAMLFLAAMNFRANFFYFAFGAFLVYILMENRFYIDNSAFVYLALGIVMALYNADEGLLSMIRCFAPFCLYLVGLNMITNNKDLRRVERKGYGLLVAICLGSFTHYVVNYLYNFDSQLGRNTNDIWTGTTMAATGQVALACLMMGLAVAMLYLPRKNWHRLAAIGAMALILLYNMILATRTAIVSLAILLVVGLFYPKKGAPDRRLKQFLAFGGILGAVIAVFALDIGGVSGLIGESNLLSRMEKMVDGSVISDGLRLQHKLPYLSEMLDHPFGGLHMREKYGYAHDLLLDGYDEYGVFGFGLLTAVLLMGIRQGWRLLRRTDYSQEYKLALLLVYMAVLLEFLVEPILSGMAWLFACFSLINGSVAGMNRQWQRLGKPGSDVVL